MDDQVKDFLTYDYGEAKDLAKSFLTLVSAILVGTITFSEKIINFQTAPALQRRLIISSWSLFVLAIISCGIGLIFLYNAANMAAQCGLNLCEMEYSFVGTVTMGAWNFLVLGNDFLGVAGTLFVVGLVCLVVSAVVAARPAPPVPPKEGDIRT